MLRISRIVFLGLMLVIGPVQASDEASPTVVDMSALMSLEGLLPALSDKRVVFVGETHDRYDHHLNQLAIIKHQFQQNKQLAIGIEFVQQPFQAVLDDYVAGRIDEATMLRQTEYFDRWQYDFRLYRPIFSFARDKGIPLIALNIDRDITDAVKRGGIEGLTADQKARLPVEIDRDDEAYRERLLAIFEHHPKHEDADFDSFVEIQLLWDESMAERAAQWLQANPDGQMVVLAGAGHIIFGSGIPDRVVRRVDVSSRSVINLDQQDALEPGLGDYVIMSRKQELPASGKLGAILDATVSPPKIIGFGPGSGAQKAGLKENDAITRIAGMAIDTYADIRIAMLDMPVDEVIEVEVLRKGLFGGQKSKQFEVTLK